MKKYFNKITLPIFPTNPLYQVIIDTVTNAENNLDNFLYLLQCHTGLGKTYCMACFILDKMIQANNEYITNINKLLEKIDELFNYVAQSKNIDSIVNKYKKQLEQEIEFKYNDYYSVVKYRIIVTITDFINNKNNGIKIDSEIQRIFNECKQIFKEPIEVKPIVTITDSIENITNFYNTLKKLIEDNNNLQAGEKNLLKSQIIHLHSNSNQLKEIDTNKIEQLITIVKADHSTKKLFNKFKRKKVFYKRISSIKDINSADIEIETEEYNQLIKDLYKELSRNTQNYCKSLYKQHKSLDIELRLIIYEVFPATKFTEQDAFVLFMTTSKYLKPITAIPSYFNFITKDITHLLIIDEFDRQHAVIRKELLKIKQYELLKGFKSVMQCVSLHKIETSVEFKGINNIMQPHINYIREVSNKYKLENHFNFESEYEIFEQIKLFYAPDDGCSVVVVEGDKKEKKKVEVLLNYKNENINLLKIINEVCIASDKTKASTNHDESFLHIINDINKAYTSFLKAIKKAVYQLIKNSKDTEAPEYTTMQAIKIIISQYNLLVIFNDVQDYIFSIDKSITIKRKKKTKNKAFHQSGFKYTRVTRKNASERTCEFLSYDLPFSDTGLIVQLVNKGNSIIGISATANAETVLRNFDYHYIKKQLGNKLLEHTAKQKDIINEYYHRKFNYTNINIDTQFITGDAIDLFAFFKNEHEKKDHFINMYPNSVKDDDYYYLEKRLVKLLQAINLFINNINSRYMLCFATRVLGINYEEKKFITKVINKYTKDAGVDAVLFSGINAEKLKQKEFTKIKNTLSTTEKKVIVLSSNMTIGAGYNPDYLASIKDLESIVFVDTTSYKPKERRVDADTIYIEKPTNVFPVDDEDYKISVPYDLSLLKAANKIDAKIHKKHIKIVLESNSLESINKDLQASYMSKKNNTRDTFSNSNDYRAAVLLIIKQLIGRGSRTVYKRPLISIYADVELIGILQEDQDANNNNCVSHEYKALVAASKRFKMQKTLHIPNELQTLHTKAVNDNKSSHKFISDILLNLNLPKRHKKIEHYNNLNKTLGKLKNNSLDKSKFIKIITSNINNLKYFLDVNELINLIKQCDNNEISKLHNEFTQNLIKKMQKIKEEIDTPYIDWKKLRINSLEDPTTDDNAESEHIHIETPLNNLQNTVGYKYEGIPEYHKLDKFKFFAKNLTQEVSEKEVDLPLIMSNPVIKKWFINRKFAISWKNKKYTMTPVICKTIYQAAISEQAYHAIIISWNLKFLEMPLGTEETFDGITEDNHGNKILTDIKHWRNSHELQISDMKKAYKIVEKTGITKIMYVNMICKNKQEQSVKYYTKHFKRTHKKNAHIIEVPGFIDTNTGLEVTEHIEAIIDFLSI